MNSTHDNVDKADLIISRAATIPSAQPVAFKLFNIFSDKNHTSNELIEAIKYDAALTGSILKMSNSALYRRSKSVDTLDQAVMRLGDAAIIHIVTTTAMNDVANTGQSLYINQNALWRHAVYASIAGRHLAQIRSGLNVNHDIAFTTCLLHDIGKAVFNASDCQETTTILSQARKTNTPIIDIERKVLGTDHTIVGNRLLLKWGVDKSICSAILKHHEDYDEDPLASICIAANYFAKKVEGLLPHTFTLSKELSNALDLDDHLNALILAKIQDEGEKTLSAYE